VPVQETGFWPPRENRQEVEGKKRDLSETGKKPVELKKGWTKEEIHRKSKGGETKSKTAKRKRPIGSH